MHFCQSCPKCTTGTLTRRGDQWGDYLSCMSCGLLAGLPENCQTHDQVWSEIVQLHREFAGEAVAADGLDAAAA